MQESSKMQVRIVLLQLLLSAEQIHSTFHQSKIITGLRPVKRNVSHDNILRATPHKDNERARMERNLENMMGDDWRLFRAKLVATEQLEMIEIDGGCSSSNDDRKENQNHFGKLFKNAVSIFNNSKHSTKRIDDEIMLNGFRQSCADPFATVDEITAVTKPKVNVNKHKWAHMISHIEPGCVLLATERLRGVFQHSIVLIIDHNDAVGSTGIVINRHMPGTLKKVASEEKSNIDTSIKLAFASSKVSYGGPVMEQNYSILHGYGEVDGSKKVSPGVFVGGSRELMNELRKDRFDPKDALFLKGHAAWVPSQLSHEVNKGVWYTASVSPDFILMNADKLKDDNSDSVDLWCQILKSIGGKYADIAMRHCGDTLLAP